MAAAALPEGPRLAVLVLSSLTEASRRRRCFQRAATLSLTAPRRAGWLPLPHGGHLMLRYLISTEPPRAFLADESICTASASEVLRRCEAGAFIG